MSTSNHAKEANENETRSPAIELLMAQNTGDAKSMYFHIPLVPGSLASDLHLLRELLKLLYKYKITTQALMPIVKSGYGPDAVVQQSGLILLVTIQNMAPAEIVCVRLKCRETICLMASNKGLSNDRGNWRYFTHHTIGRLNDACVRERTRTVTEGIRTQFLLGGDVDGLIHYRVNQDGVLESAEIDFIEDSVPLEFEEATIPRQ
jgi:hypothetical protein